ncbi:hypothetical protein [Nocardia yamanashiensis]|uniref:hypothetical protein n=1 Tax=Nocardia yamanashiensis TaxID=209247 RepID=UPI0008295656|nr:hypothetical protein [Nocardia yamanashiensis]
MKRILLVLGTFGIVVGLSTGIARADNFSGSTSGSCSGTVGSWGFFYAYTYQYAFISADTIEEEVHDFAFDGFLSGAENARLLNGKQRTWIVYRKGDFDLAVPYVKGAGLFVRDNRDRDDDWVKLCSY